MIWWFIAKSLALLGIAVSFGWASGDLYYFGFPIWGLALGIFAFVVAGGFIIHDLWRDATDSRLTC